MTGNFKIMNMKRPLKLLAAAVMLLAASPFNNAVSVETGFYDDLRNSSWHDGFVFYHPEKHAKNAKSLRFAGGTMHEGGYDVTLTDFKTKNGKVTGGTVKSEFSEDKQAQLVITEGGGKKYSMLHIRDAKGRLIHIYNPLDKNVAEVWGARLIDLNNVYLTLRGRYLDNKGNLYVFTLGDLTDNLKEVKDPSSLNPAEREDGCILITPAGTERLEFAEEYDFTVPVFKMDGIYVEARPTVKGLEIRYIRDFDDIRNPEGTPAEGIYKMLYPSPDTPRFLFTADQVINEGLLGHYDYQTLRLMRNEIMARHGYSFKSPDLQSYFDKTSWYQPVSQDIKLSPVEKINVELIKLAEDRKKQEEAAEEDQ